MSSPDPVPSYFNCRYVIWLVWANAITILSAIQGALAGLMLVASPDDQHPLLPHDVYRWLVLGNALLTGFVSQVKRNNPVSPAPTRSQEPPK